LPVFCRHLSWHHDATIYFCCAKASFCILR
jgi:hypothetical protein